MRSARVQAVAVGLFVLIIAGVVTVLLMNVDRTVPAAKAPSAEPSNDLESAAQDPIGRLTLTAGKGDVVVRVTAGSCAQAGGPKLELSDNRGRTFHQILVPQIDDGSGVSASSPKVRAIVVAEATSALKMTVGAADAKCVVHPYTTANGGVTWKPEPGTVKEWYLDPKTGGVVSPTGPTDVGCAGVVSLAPATKATAKAFCLDGTIRGTSDGGATWIDAGKLADTTAAVFTGGQTGYAAVKEAGCQSRVYATLNGGLSWTPQGCVVKELALPGFTGTDARLVAGGTGGVRLSTDRGATWKPSKVK